MRIISAVFPVLFLMLSIQPARACEFCTIAYMGKKEKSANDKKHSFAAKVLFENQNWKEIPAGQAHQLHHQGHHTHDKQDEQIIHTLLTAYVNDRLSFDLDIPYVTRHFIEIDSHAHLGENQTSRGLGDIVITGDYRLIQGQDKSLGIIAGLKTPSGGTDEYTSFGGLMEPELQPGSGSLDYVAGLSGSLHLGAMDFSASVIYIYRTEGAQDFRFSDLLSVSFHAEKKFDLKDKFWFKPGIMMNNQLEKKQNNEDGAVKDSGGYTIFIGPQISLGYDSLGMEFSYLAPAVQSLGGTHQELDKGIWASSLGIKF